MNLKFGDKTSIRYKKCLYVIEDLQKKIKDINTKLYRNATEYKKKKLKIQGLIELNQEELITLEKKLKCS
jgi:hypothetical protein